LTEALGEGLPWTPSGSTHLAAVIGDPIAHSLSPAIHNAAFRALGLDWVYVAFPVRSGDVPRALEGMRAFGIDGLSVTMPHKDDAALGVDELDEDATALQAVNCVERRDEQLIGHNTDGPGFVAAIRDAGFDPYGRRCVVVGAGGAARAVVLALGRAGAAEVTVVNRTPEKAESAAALAGTVGRVGDAQAVVGAELIVNATPIGMGESAERGETPFAVDLLRPEHTVVDLVVHPVETPLLRAAVQRGATAIDGVGMLVHQAAIAFEIWTGATPPVAVMQAAARSRLR
jgi:shikimate dehydrogenase